jgi:CheY-like chemotaxis protein
MYALRLTASGFDVTTAHSGAEALLMVNDSLPDLIYLDLGLPGMGGLEVLEHLRKGPDTAGIPVVTSPTSANPACSNGAGASAPRITSSRSTRRPRNWPSLRASGCSTPRTDPANQP